MHISLSMSTIQNLIWLIKNSNIYNLNQTQKEANTRNRIYSRCGSRMNIQRKQVPIWPINAVSTREAIGSAVKASAAGNAIRAISNPSSSMEKKRTPACIFFNDFRYSFDKFDFFF